MICKDLDCGGGAEKVMAPGIYGSHDGEQFPVIDVIVALSRAKCLGQISARMPLIVDVFLQKNSSRSMFGGISGNGERGREIWEVKDWLGGECSFQCCKGIITGLVPGPGVSFFGEVKRGWVVSE